MCYEVGWVVFRSLSCYKELKLTIKLHVFTGHTVQGLLIQMQNISLQSSGMCRKQNFEFWCLRVTQQSWLLLFAFPPLLLFRFFCLIFFSLAGRLVGFILVGKVFRKAFRILALDERKGRWAVEKDFHAIFQVNVLWFFAFFSSVLDRIVLILVWFKRSFPFAQVSGQSCPWPLELMKLVVKEGI